MNAIAIFDTSIRQDAEGRFSLNDLHHAAGGKPTQKPSEWLALDRTHEIAELLSTEDPRNQPIHAQEGRHGDTFVCRELAIFYLTWISPSFYLKVLQSLAQPADVQASFNRGGAAA